MRNKIPPSQVADDWQKFLRYNVESLCLTGHCLKRLKQRFFDFYQAHSAQEISDFIRAGQPITEEFTMDGLCICVQALDMKFLIDIQSGQVMTVLTPEMTTGTDRFSMFRSIKKRKWQKNGRRCKVKVCFVG